MKIKLILELSSKEIHGIYLIFVILILTLSCVIAQMLYPVPYSMLDYHVSAQGGINANTQGYKYWNIGMIITGILLIPHMLYLHRSYSSTSPKISIISFIISIIACLSISLIGIFPGDLGLPHLIVGCSTFIGFFIAFNLDGIILMKRKIQIPNQWPQTWYYLLFYFFLNCSFIGALTIPEISFNFDKIPFDPRWLSFPIWEWDLFISVFIWMIGIFLLMPEPLKNKN